jgi:glycosyltransferase involved in cell wall biosynthesis
MKGKKSIVMLGTGFDTKGGISAVVNEYKQAGLFHRFPILYLATHTDGSALKKVFLCIASWLQFMGLLLRGKIALIHVHIASDASFWRKSLFLCPAILCRIPSILHLHGAEFSRFYEKDCNRVAKWFVRYIFNHVDIVVALSVTWQRWIQGISSNSRILSINNPVQLPTVSDFNLRESASILFLGRLGDRKGTYDLLLAVSRMVGRHPKLKLLLGGDGDIERVKIQIEQLGITPHVEVLGWVSGATKLELLQRAAIYALPSYAEGLPMSVLEAMATGMPVVSTPVGGIPEVITNDLEGYLVAPGDVPALSEALERLLSDANLRQRLGTAARNKVESTFSTQHVMPQIAQLYLELGRNL